MMKFAILPTAAVLSIVSFVGAETYYPISGKQPFLSFGRRNPPYGYSGPISIDDWRRYNADTSTYSRIVRQQSAPSNAMNQIMAGVTGSTCDYCGGLYKIPVHVIYYGTISSSDISLINFYINNIGSTLNLPYYFGNIRQFQTTDWQTDPSRPVTYFPGIPSLGTYIQVPTNRYAIGRAGTNTTYGTHWAVTDSDLYNLINAVTNTSNPLLPRNSGTAVYIVVGGSDVVNLNSESTSSSGCEHYCGFHNWVTSTSVSNGGWKYMAYIQRGDKCSSKCGPAAESHIYPNSQDMAEVQIRTLNHELLEFITNREGSGWIDSEGIEVMDRCMSAFNNTKTYTRSDGKTATYSVSVRSAVSGSCPGSTCKYFLLDSIWDYDVKKCDNHL